VERAFPSQAPYDYGRCACGGTYESHSVPVTFQTTDVVLTDVPQGKCPDCGAWIYKARVLDRIERIYTGREPATEPHPLDL
jgi:YgiT-type zinc finger domain-containing protein